MGVYILNSLIAVSWDIIGVGVCVSDGLVAIGWGVIGVGVCVLNSFIAVGWGVVEGIGIREYFVYYFFRVPCVL